MYFPRYGGTAFKKGDSGREVKMMQDCLDSIFTKYPLSDNICGEPDFGIKTERAVKCLQRVVGLETDGVIGPATWDAILTLANFFSNS